MARVLQQARQLSPPPIPGENGIRHQVNSTAPGYSRASSGMGKRARCLSVAGRKCVTGAGRAANAGRLGTVGHAGGPSGAGSATLCLRGRRAARLPGRGRGAGGAGGGGSTRRRAGGGAHRHGLRRGLLGAGFRGRPGPVPAEGPPRWYCRVPVPEELLRDLLPGPVTLVLPRSDALNADLNPFTPLVGVRVPNHRFVRELARACGSALALTSANVSERASSISVTEFQELWPHLSLVIDGGPIGDALSPECRLGSTVVDLSIPGKYRVIRPGCALAQTIEILVSKYGLRAEESGN